MSPTNRISMIEWNKCWNKKKNKITVVSRKCVEKICMECITIINKFN